MKHYPHPKIIVAMDFANEAQALCLAEQLNPAQCRLKVGKELFTRFGTSLVQQFMDRGFSIFLDLKYHDIPNTVARACLAAADLGVWMVNIHTLGGPKMMEAAANQLAKLREPKPLLIGVTILTSHNDADMAAIGLQGTVMDNATKLALQAKQAGLDGVVCSAQEATHLKKNCGADFCLVTPGIRLQAVADDDQQRVMTPTNAIANGADYLVIGRPITQAESPQLVLSSIADSLP